MSPYNRKALPLLAMGGIDLCIGGSFYPTAQKWAILAGFVGGLALVVLLIGCMLNRQERKHGNKTGRYCSAMHARKCPPGAPHHAEPGRRPPPLRPIIPRLTQEKYPRRQE